MAACHTQAMRIAGRLENSLSLMQLPVIEQARLMGTMAKLFEVVQNGALAIQNSRAVAPQRVESQYQQVNVSGGQAVVANKMTPRPRRKGARAKRGGIRNERSTHAQRLNWPIRTIDQKVPGPGKIARP
jgi:hypothetical protein